MSSDTEENYENDGDILTKRKVKTPRKYKVLLHNDDYTTMEFVVYILQRIFSMSLIQAQATMLEVHEKGTGECGVYSKEIAETKVNQVEKESRQNGHPLRCSYQPE